MVAARSSATSPRTGVVMKVDTVLMLPSKVELSAVPVMTLAPPVMTVMKALAT